ncbi:MAG: hypothetical protein PSX37_00330 [bacterium]|nr:hypothetical protein [bacterium]
MLTQLETSSPPKATSGARWFSAVRELLDSIPRPTRRTDGPALPCPGTQPIEHVENALATWARLWQECALVVLHRTGAVEPTHDDASAEVGELADAARRAVVVSRAVAAPDFQDDLASLLDDAEHLLSGWLDAREQFAADVINRGIRAVLSRASELKARVRAPAGQLVGWGARTRSAS